MCVCERMEWGDGGKFCACDLRRYSDALSKKNKWL